MTKTTEPPMFCTEFVPSDPDGCGRSADDHDPPRRSENSDMTTESYPEEPKECT